MPKRSKIVVSIAILAILTACGPVVEAPKTIVHHDDVVIKTPAPIAQATNAYTLVMLGDSLTAGLGLAPDNAFPHIIEMDFDARSGQKITVLNAGVSGDTTASGLARFDWSVGPNAHGVLIALGANDMLNGLDPAQTRRNLAAMIEKARLRDLDVFLAGMRAAPNLGAQYTEEFDALYADLSRQHCVPLFTFLLQPLANEDGTNIEHGLIQGDGLHPTSQGAARIGHALSGWLAKALNTPHVPCTQN